MFCISYALAFWGGCAVCGYDYVLAPWRRGVPAKTESERVLFGVASLSMAACCSEMSRPSAGCSTSAAAEQKAVDDRLLGGVNEIGKRLHAALEVATGWLEQNCPSTMVLLSCFFTRRILRTQTTPWSMVPLATSKLRSSWRKRRKECRRRGKTKSSTIP